MIRQVRPISTVPREDRPAPAARRPRDRGPTIFTVGHSTRSLEELLHLPRVHEIRQIAAYYQPFAPAAAPDLSHGCPQRRASGLSRASGMTI